MQVGVRWPEERSGFCAERIMPESRSPVSNQAGLPSPWAGLPVLASRQNMLLLSSLFQWSFKCSGSLNTCGVCASVLQILFAECH